MGITVVGQIIIVQFAGILFGCIEFNPAKGKYGMPWRLWVVSLVLSALTLVVGQITFFIPVPKTKPKKFKGKQGIISRILSCNFKGDKNSSSSSSSSEEENEKAPLVKSSPKPEEN